MSPSITWYIAKLTMKSSTETAPSRSRSIISNNETASCSAMSTWNAKEIRVTGERIPRCRRRIMYFQKPTAFCASDHTRIGVLNARLLNDGTHNNKTFMLSPVHYGMDFARLHYVEISNAEQSASCRTHSCEHPSG